MYYRLDEIKNSDVDVAKAERQFEQKIREINQTRVEMVKEYQSVVKVNFLLEFIQNIQNKHTFSN